MNDISSVDRHRLKKEIEVLKAKKGRGTELVSIYIPPDKNLDDVMSQMRNEYSQASNIKSKRTRKNVLSALDTIKQRLKLIKKVPDNGLVLFVGTIPKGIQDRMEVHLVEPPDQITTYRYRCDSEFLLGPIEAMLEESKTYGLLVLDRREATIGLLKGKIIESVKRLTSGVPGKTRRGGQSAKRYEHLREIAAHEFFVRIGEHASKIFLNTPEFKGVLIGGPGPTKDYFVKEEYLHHEIQNNILGVLDVSYTGEFGIHELVDNASNLLQGLEVMKEKNLVQKFLSEVVKGNGLAAYGEKEVRRLLQKGAVKTLLISEGVESVRATVRCSSCDHSEEKISKNLNTLEKKLSEQPCPKCNGMTLYLHESKSSLDELSELAKSTNADVEVISEETEEGQQLRAFGGIVAILRFTPG
ncbi:MAG: peptide chain release factor aRF-1 [Candidatus Hydrothermarchaeales archaeon]